MTDLLCIASGASLGAISRYLIAKAPFFNGSNYYLAVLFINIVGSAIFGFLQAFFNSTMKGYSPISAMIFTGFLGSFTTFSALSYDTHNLFLEQRFFTAGLNIIMQIILSLLFFYICFWLGDAIQK
jgi:fluoride exporter